MTDAASEGLSPLPKAFNLDGSPVEAVTSGELQEGLNEVWEHSKQIFGFINGFGSLRNFFEENVGKVGSVQVIISERPLPGLDEVADMLDGRGIPQMSDFTYVGEFRAEQDGYTFHMKYLENNERFTLVFDNDGVARYISKDDQVVAERRFGMGDSVPLLEGKVSVSGVREDGWQVVADDSVRDGVAEEVVEHSRWLGELLGRETSIIRLARNSSLGSGEAYIEMPLQSG